MLKIFFLKAVGTIGRAEPVDTSQYIWVLFTGSSCIWREDKALARAVSSQDNCEAAIAEKSRGCSADTAHMGAAWIVVEAEEGHEGVVGDVVEQLARGEAEGVEQLAGLGGRDRVSATTFSLPGTCLIRLVNSAT